MIDQLHLLTSPFVIEFLREYADLDVQKLVLNPPSELRQHIRLVADQLISRQKAREKLPLWFNTVGIVFPPPLSVEQSSSGDAAHYKTRLISGKHLVDLTGGMGVDCLALSRHFAKSTYVEQDKWLCTLFTHNQKLLSDHPIAVENVCAEDYLEEFRGKAAFFIDPARRDPSNKKVFRFEDCSPDITKMLPQLRKKADAVLIKAAPLIDLSLGIRQLQNVREVHVLSIRKEVKEVLFLLDFEFSGEPDIHCIYSDDGPKADFTFTLSKEKSITLDHHQAGKYLYDPEPSILKAGAFKSIAKSYSVQKISANTHLYTSDEPVTGFPGRIFEVLSPDVKKQEIDRLLPHRKANIMTKNYPLKPEEVKKKYRIKDGGELFLICFRGPDDKPAMVLAQLKDKDWPVHLQV